MSERVLEVTGLGVGVGALRTLDGIDLRIDAGELVGVTGEPGAGKTMLVRALAGELTAASGEIRVNGVRLTSEPGAAELLGVSVVWQDLELCDSLDVASNLLLGRETRRLLVSDSRFHAAAAAELARWQIPIRDTARLAGSLPGGLRQLLAIARALGRTPRLLLLDEPTVALAAAETEQVERLIALLRERGAAILLAGRDIQQLLRLADRLVVLREGRLVAEVDPHGTHPEEVAALASGQQIDASARRQLRRLHGLADQLASADPSSGRSLIVSTLAAALGVDAAAVQVLPASGLGGIAQPPIDSVVVDDGRWLVPITGPAGVSAVIAVERNGSEPPQRDELELLALYAGHAAGMVERERLLAQVTARNRVLETVREMLQGLAGAIAIEDALPLALQSLRRGLQADEVGVLIDHVSAGNWRGYGSRNGVVAPSPEFDQAARALLADARRDGVARELAVAGRMLAVPFNAPGGPALLAARWVHGGGAEDDPALIEDAAHSLNLALEREESANAHQEAAALRRSRELQRGFLSRLSHELRTPLTAIRGYASSLLAGDVTWDGESQARFLQRIAAESARLGRLVDDLLDFSAIESGVMRLQPDWCELPLVLEAAVACLPGPWRDAVTVHAAPELPVVWADHDRLEQVFVNLLGNALRHNPPGTNVEVSASLQGADQVEIEVADNGAGFPATLTGSPFDQIRRPRTPNAGAGLGLSIARGIVLGHGGELELLDGRAGTTFRILLPVEHGAAVSSGIGTADA